MATFTTAAKSGGNAAGFPSFTVLSGTYDASKQNAAATDVIEVVTIPAGTVVWNVVSEIDTADAAGGIDVGDGGDPNGWVAAQASDAVGSALGGGAYVVAGGKYYATADTIDIDPAIICDTLKVNVYVLCTIVGLTTT